MEHKQWEIFWKGLLKDRINELTPQQAVLRTKDGKEINKDTFWAIVSVIDAYLELKPEDQLLDLCAGTGVFAEPLSEECKAVYAVDMSADHLRYIDTEKYPNIFIAQGDVTTYPFKRHPFTKALMYAGIQYLTFAEVVPLFTAMHSALPVGGYFYIGDIPDIAKLRNFYDTKERRADYYEMLKKDGHDQIGTWFHREWLEAAAKEACFSSLTIQQPDFFPYSHYRFDMMVTKND